MSLVRPGQSSIFVTLRFHLKISRRIGCVFTTFGTPMRSIFLPNFSVIRKNTRRSLLIARFVTKYNGFSILIDRIVLPPVSVSRSRSRWTRSPFRLMNLCTDAKASSSRALVNLCFPRFQGTTSKHFFDRQPKK